MDTKRRRLSVDEAASGFRSAVPQPVPGAALRLGEPTFTVNFSEHASARGFGLLTVTRAMTLDQLRYFLTAIANGQDRDVYFHLPIRIFVSGAHDGRVLEPLCGPPVLWVQGAFPIESGGPRPLNILTYLGYGEHRAEVWIPVTVDAIVSVAQSLWWHYELDVQIRQRDAQRVYEAIDAPDVRRLIASYLPYVRPQNAEHRRRLSRVHFT